MSSYSSGFKFGFIAAKQKAAELLEATASDYEQMEKQAAKELSKASTLDAAHWRRELVRFQEKAQLLRGQASHVKNIKQD